MKWVTRGTAIAVASVFRAAVSARGCRVWFLKRYVDFAIFPLVLHSNLVRLCHPSLSLDGRRHHLQAWRDVHAGDGLHHRPVRHLCGACRRTCSDPDSNR